MKRIFLVLVILFTASTIMYAQQAAGPSRQDMQAYLNQVRENSSRFDSMLEEIIDRNSTSALTRSFARLVAQIDSLAARIQAEVTGITAIHDRGNFVSESMIERVERLINLHKARQEELERLLSN